MISLLPFGGSHGVVPWRVIWPEIPGSNECPLLRFDVFPQIAIAIGVLTSNRRRATNHFTLADWTWRMPLQGAIVGCHCSVLSLQGAIVVCYGWTGGDDQLWGMDVVPLLGAIAGCQRILDAIAVIAVISGKNMWREKKHCLALLADVTLFSTLITQKLFFTIWGLCWYNFPDEFPTASVFVEGVLVWC